MNIYGYMFIGLVLAFIGVIAFSVKFVKLPEEMEESNKKDK